MKAFLGEETVKLKYLNRVQDHAKADEIIKGRYWSEGKGCAVGCTIHSNSHKAYETELGIPEWLARVEDTIFEGLPNERAQQWPSEFLSAISVGADLSTVEAPFVIFILQSSLEQFDNAKFPQVVAVIQTCIELYKKGALAQSEEWSAAWSAESAARSAARSAESAARSAESAAWSAAYVKFADKLLDLLKEAK